MISDHPPQRTHAVLGLQGLLPYSYNTEAALFLSNKGEFTARVNADYDLLITQRLILQPRVEANFSAQNIRELGVGSGLSTIELGLRLRYEFIPEFAPLCRGRVRTKRRDHRQFCAREWRGRRKLALSRRSQVVVLKRFQLNPARIQRL